MHVGRGAFELAQPRCFEGVIGGGKMQHRAATAVRIRQADVVEIAVRERVAGVAVRAPGLAGEQFEPVDLLRGQRALVTLDPAIEARRRRHQRTLIGRDRLGEIVSTDLWVFRKCLGKCGLILRIGGEPSDQRILRLRHLVRRFERSKHLLLEILRTAIPEQQMHPGQIPQARRMPPKPLPGDALAALAAIRKCFVLEVAGRTRGAAVDRQTLVVEQRLSQRALGLRRTDCRPEMEWPRDVGTRP